jgi:hypothetical protein
MSRNVGKDLRNIRKMYEIVLHKFPGTVLGITDHKAFTSDPSSHRYTAGLKKSDGFYLDAYGTSGPSRVEAAKRHLATRGIHYDLDSGSFTVVPIKQPLSFYIASKTKHADKWRELRDNAGVNIISTWIDEAGVGETKCFSDLWTRCINEASSADVLIVYVEEGEQLKGGFVEVGAALASKKPVFGAGATSQFSFSKHPMFLDTLSSVNEAIAYANELHRAGLLR